MHTNCLNKIVEEKLGKLDSLVAKVDNLALDVKILKIKNMPHDAKESKTLNVMQIKIYNNIRMLVELHERWEREENKVETAKKVV